jgi:acetylornithine/succinyldiaminopimelate/putrescine aminotransferase
MERDDIPARAAKAGEYLHRELADLPGVVEVRGLGLLLAVELEPGRDARAVQAAALASGLVVNAVTPTALRLAPPLTVEGAEIDEALAILRSVLQAEEV